MSLGRLRAEAGLIALLAGACLLLAFAFGWTVLFVLGSRDPRWFWGVPSLAAGFTGAAAFALDREPGSPGRRLLRTAARTGAAGALAWILLVCAAAAVSPHVTLADILGRALEEVQDGAKGLLLEARRARRRPPKAALQAGPVLQLPPGSTVSAPGGHAWLRVETAEGAIFVDSASALAWGPALAEDFGTWQDADVRAAMRLCLRQEPAGSWRLPAVADFMAAQEHEAAEVLEDFRSDWIATALLEKDLLLGGAALMAPRDNNAAGARRYRLRCVARAGSAP